MRLNRLYKERRFTNDNYYHTIISCTIIEFEIKTRLSTLYNRIIIYRAASILGESEHFR